MVTSLLRSEWEAMFQAGALIIPLPRRLCQAMASQSPLRSHSITCAKRMPERSSKRSRFPELTSLPNGLSRSPPRSGGKPCWHAFVVPMSAISRMTELGEPGCNVCLPSRLVPNLVAVVRRRWLGAYRRGLMNPAWSVALTDCFHSSRFPASAASGKCARALSPRGFYCRRIRLRLAG
jgi:hypothetical protein